jgi:SAM-dependent methyltransferase
MKCPICHNQENNSELIAKEMMIGTRDLFQYMACSNCGCLWLQEMPTNIAEYYPKDYYSFIKKNTSAYEKFAKKEISLSRLNKGSILGKILKPLYPNYLKWLNGYCKIDFGSKILDVGTGTGRLLLEMNEFGFLNLTGIDPFIEADINYNKGVTVYKKSIEHIDERYDFVMLHHSFEHMLEPSSVIKKIKAILKPNGIALIRTPLADSYGYETYGANWVELDPPRHFFLHTQKSMRLLAAENELKIDHVMYDSSSFEIIESEKWKEDIPSSENGRMYSEKEKKKIDNFVNRLNQTEKGSRACFYISHS